ncbi:MAG TPA: hypothetical protein VIV60_17675 [Polyangiaceae bacterium]
MRRLVALLFLASGCATYRDDLSRGQRMYLDTHYDQALAIWRVLERDFDSLSPAEQSRYAHLRGMTDYRLGLRADARHWLAIAKATNEAHPGGIDAETAPQLERALEELNQETYAMLPGPDPKPKQ